MKIKTFSGTTYEVVPADDHGTTPTITRWSETPVYEAGRGNVLCPPELQPLGVLELLDLGPVVVGEPLRFRAVVNGQEGRFTSTPVVEVEDD